MLVARDVVGACRLLKASFRRVETPRMDFLLQLGLCRDTLRSCLLVFMQEVPKDVEFLVIFARFLSLDPIPFCFFFWVHLIVSRTVSAVRRYLALLRLRNGLFQRLAPSRVHAAGRTRQYKRSPLVRVASRNA